MKTTMILTHFVFCAMLRGTCTKATQNIEPKNIDWFFFRPKYCWKKHAPWKFGCKFAYKLSYMYASLGATLHANFHGTIPVWVKLSVQVCIPMTKLSYPKFSSLFFLNIRCKFASKLSYWVCNFACKLSYWVCNFACKFALKVAY